MGVRSSRHAFGDRRGADSGGVASEETSRTIGEPSASPGGAGLHISSQRQWKVDSQHIHEICKWCSPAANVVLGENVAFRTRVDIFMSSIPAHGASIRHVAHCGWATVAVYSVLTSMPG